jgi:mono/diheme cytochrome c family protein
LVVLLVVVAWLLSSPETSLPADIADQWESADRSELIARGEYLATAGNCGSCHTVPGGAFMAGGLAFETPFGTIYSTNITPDAATGIGRWSVEDFLRSMRYGVRPGGEHLYPAFPYTNFTRTADEDLLAIYAYLLSLEAAEKAPEPNALSFPFNIRALMAAWKRLFFDAGPYEDDPAQSAEWNRGAYLVEALAHCGACHTPRNSLGAERRDQRMGGGSYTDRVPGGHYRRWSTPNLTPSARGLGLWSREELVSYLRTGRNAFLDTFGPMNEVIINSTSRLAAEDVQSIALYLESLPALDEAPGGAVSDNVMGRGRTIYNLHCGTCHLPTGLGDPEMAPRLDSGSLVVQQDDPASMINAILYGPELAALAPRWRNPMEEFQYLLDDEEVAAVASFIRNSWGNRAGRVSAEQVAAQR